MKDTELDVEETLLVDGAVAPHHVADHHDERPTVRIGARKTARPQSQDEAPKPPSSPSRRPWTWVLLALLAIGAIGGGTAYYLYALGYESTDDAFIAGHVVPISARVAGHVAKEGVRVTDNQAVKEANSWWSWIPGTSRPSWPPRKRDSRPPRRASAAGPSAPT